MKKFILKHKVIIVCTILISIIVLNLTILNSRKKTSFNQLALSAYYNDRIIADPVNVSNDSNVELEINFKYLGEKNKQFDLTLYWDYEQTPFNVDNKQYNTYSFSEDSSSYTKKINVKLNKKFNNHIHKITAIINDRNFNITKGMRLRTQAIYTFINSQSNNTKLVSDSSKPYKVYSDNLPNTLIINRDFDTEIKKYSEGSNSQNESTFSIKPNSKIDLALRFSNLVGNGDQLLIIELNNQQIQINDHPYLVYNLTSTNKTIFDKVSITSPKMPGIYNVTAFIVPNFFDTKSRLYYHNTITFKLEVK